MQNYYLALAMCSALLANGCHHGLLQKRQSEMNCPTDIRKTIPWCAGEDAIFRCPCGPSSNFYGHKPTCWGYWPAPGAEWRDSYCGCPVQYATEEELSVPTPVAEPLPEATEPNTESSDREPVSARPAQQRAEPLFVPPQPPVSQQSKAVNGRFQDDRISLTEPARLIKRSSNHKSRMHSGDIQQVCHTEEVKLEAHAWTGVKFIR